MHRSQVFWMDFAQSQESQGVEYHRTHFQENFPCLETKEIRDHKGYVNSVRWGTETIRNVERENDHLIWSLGCHQWPYREQFQKCQQSRSQTVRNKSQMRGWRWGSKAPLEYLRTLRQKWGERGGIWYGEIWVYFTAVGENQSGVGFSYS